MHVGGMARGTSNSISIDTGYSRYVYMNCLPLLGGKRNNEVCNRLSLLIVRQLLYFCCLQLLGHRRTEHGNGDPGAACPTHRGDAVQVVIVPLRVEPHATATVQVSKGRASTAFVTALLVLG